MMYAICQKEEMGFDKAVEVRIPPFAFPVAAYNAPPTLTMCVSDVAGMQVP